MAKNFSIDGDPEVMLRAERVAQLRKQMDESSARCDAWNAMRCDPENWTRRQREANRLPAGTTMIESLEEWQAEVERYRSLVTEWEGAQHDLNRERSAARRRLRDAHRAEHQARKVAVAETATAFSTAVQRYAELSALFVDENALRISTALDATEPASALRALLLDLIAHKLLDASAVPAIPELADKSAAIPTRKANNESKWLPASAPPAMAARR